MKKLTNIHNSTVPCRNWIITAILIAVLPCSLIGSENPSDDSYLEGVAVFKIHTGYQVDIPVKGAEQMGIPELDLFMNDINAYHVERKYPHCLPPIPGGTDLTRIYSMYFPKNLDVIDVCRDLEKLDAVEYAEPWYVQQVFVEYNDEYSDDQYALELVRSRDAHEICTGDPDVVIAIVDNGTDMDHPDLVDNIYINPGEDLNGDGEIQNNEINGEDDDDNGYDDDFYGWDFNGNDNDPNDDANHGHGTHVGGIASAVTNNEIGVASVGYSCSIMPVRTGRSNRITHGYEGIEYAARMGVDVINCSWGGGQAGRENRDVVDYAWEHDVVIVCAAGNNGNTTITYPAGFENCIAVAATNRSDRKAGFSTYGNWVDISAPGDEIYNCDVGGGYREWEGTSMASPLAASVAALIRAEYPEINNVATRLILLAGADNIDEENPQYAGRLGSGRVNALRSLRGIDQPLVEINSIDMAWEQNGNGRLDPGETAHFTVSLRNLGQTAEDITATISTDDPDINIIRGEALFPDLNIGESHTNDENPLIIQVEGDVISHTTTLNLTVTAQPGDIVLRGEIDALIGYPAVIIVDDDDGAEYEKMFEESVRSLHMGYLRWDIMDDDVPSVEDLTDHAMVIWITGNSYPPLDDLERWTMINAIENGANIMLMGKWIGDMQENQPFLRQNFATTHQADSITADMVSGVPGERPLGENIRVALYDPESGDSLDARISASNCGVRRESDTLMVYMNEGEINGVAGVYRYNIQTGAHTIYLGFNLEMAADIMTPRRDMMAHIFDWFTDYRSTPLPDENDPVVFMLNPSYPNPFNQAVRLNFTIPMNTNYTLSIFDLQGREITRLHDGYSQTGRYSATWNAEGMPSGIYIARLSVPNYMEQNQRLILLR